MHLTNCEHPTYVLSPHTGEFVLSSCGHCNSCKMQKASKWVGRLDLESQQHKYTYMVTLTYDQEHLPRYYFNDDMTEIVLNRDLSYRIPLSELYDLMHDEFGEYLDDDIVYLRDRLIHPLGLPAPYPKDISRFFKRFNKYCFKHITGKYENIRYFTTHEYGPTVYREHVHMLMWFDDDRISRRFSEILSACWTYGISDGSAVFSNGGRSYVAQYVNQHSHLPSFYSHPKLRQKSQFSKFPSIGSFNLLDEGVRDLYERADIKRSVWSSQSAKYVTIPIDSSIKSRFFPKCQGYRDLSDYARVVVYGAACSLYSETFEDFRYSLDLVRWCKHRNIASYDEECILRYVDILRLDSKSEEAFINSLRRWYYLTKRMCFLSSTLGLSIRYIVSRIDEFWKKIDYENLKKMYEFEVAYAKTYKVSDLIILYPDFYKMCKFWFIPSKVPLFVQYAFKSFGISEFSDVPDKEDTFDYKAMSSQALKIYKDTHKRQFVNAYRDSKLEQYDPALASIVRKYQNQKSKEINFYA